MHRFALVTAVASLATGLFAQSNTVVGLDGRLEILDNITYWGRRGAAYPGGEVGLSMRNTMCNPGSVSIPWFAQMQENHPKFGFIITRLVNDRMEQISDRSYCKHAFTSASTNGACGPCNGIGGNQMGVTCSDTYSAGNNASRNNLGPAGEINPWLGTWNHTGSYFDQGDPNVGAPGNIDGAQSPINVGSDPVKNRVTVKESDLQVAGASYYYGIHLIHEGEAVANRGDNIKSRGFTASYSTTTSSWTVANSAVGEAFGSILQHWTGATLNSGGNGNDDGRFFVASKATALGGGQYHYEYAVHNVDNNRGGATLRVPIDPSAVATNFTFRDIDANPLNNWTAARVGNEIVFTAPAGNPLDWNTIYNFGFNANFAPGSSGVQIDEARIGPGGLTVSVGAKAPSGSTFAQVAAFGAGCGNTPPCYGSFYETGYDGFSGYTLTPVAGGYDVTPLSGSWITPAGTALTLTDDSGSSQALPFSFPHANGTTNSLWICSNGFVTAAASGSTSYQSSGAGLLAMGNTTWAAMWRDLNPAAAGSGQVKFDANATRAVVSYDGVYIYQTTTPLSFQLQFYPSGVVHVIYQSIANATQPIVGYSRGQSAGDPGSMDISAALATGIHLCQTEVSGVAGVVLASSTRPVIGTTMSFNTSNIPAGTGAAILILSPTILNPGVDLTGLNMPGCTLYAPLDILFAFATPSTTATYAWGVPNDPTLSGVSAASQVATLSPGINAAGIAMSNALNLLFGIN